MKILILADFYKGAAGTILDHALSFRQFSRNKIHYFNPIRRCKPWWLSLDAYDAILIHYSIYSIHEAHLNYNWRYALAKATTMKVQFIQDEYRYVNLIRQFLKECSIDILFTCFPESEIEKIYPKKMFPNMVKVNTLTGYVPNYLSKRQYFLTSERQIDIGYRARGEGFWWLGKLFQEKLRIGIEFLKKAKQYDLNCDISNKESDRIYGEDWLHFLQNCKATLGTESGASIIDWNGSVESAVIDYCKKNPMATFTEVHRKILRPHEGKVIMNQISPRVFEAIGCGTLLVLFEGRYSSILKPNIHFVPLKKDFSNIQHVISILHNKKRRDKITQRAYTDIIESGYYSYQKFVSDFDRVLTTVVPQPKRYTQNNFSTDISTIFLSLEEQFNLQKPVFFKNRSAKIKYSIKEFLFKSKHGKTIWSILRTLRYRYSSPIQNTIRHWQFLRDRPKILYTVFTYILWRKYV